MAKILLVEDNEDIAQGLALSFELTKHELIHAENLNKAGALVKSECPGLVLLDVSLPDGSGFDFYKSVLKNSEIPTIFLTAKDEENDIVKGLELGAEDYITKPFSTRELMARVNRVTSKNEDSLLLVGEVSFDRKRAEVYRAGKRVELSALELKIVSLLFENHDKAVSRSTVIDCIYDATGNDVYDHTVTVYMNRIREKLGEGVITTIKGLGYRIDTKR